METAITAQSLQSSSSSRSGTACASNSLFPAVLFLPSAFLPVSCNRCDCLLSPLETLDFLVVSGFPSSWLSEPSPSPVSSSAASLLSIFKAEFSCSSSFLEPQQKKKTFVNRLFQTFSTESTLCTQSILWLVAIVQLKAYMYEEGR